MRPRTCPLFLHGVYHLTVCSHDSESAFAQTVFCPLMTGGKCNPPRFRAKRDWRVVFVVDRTESREQPPRDLADVKMTQMQQNYRFSSPRARTRDPLSNHTQRR